MVLKGISGLRQDSDSFERVVLVFGGGGLLGKQLFQTRPPNTFFINVSKSRDLVGPNVYNYHVDFYKETPEQILTNLSRLTDSVDVCIHAAYELGFSSVKELRSDAFLKEIYLDTYFPIKLSMLCATHFWSQEDKIQNYSRARKIINISSRAAFGKTPRPELATYSAAKAALNVLTEYLHEELFSSFGVSAHIIAPGSLQNEQTLHETCLKIWELSLKEMDSFSLTRIP